MWALSDVFVGDKAKAVVSSCSVSHAPLPVYTVGHTANGASSAANSCGEGAEEAAFSSPPQSCVHQPTKQCLPLAAAHRVLIIIRDRTPFRASMARRLARQPVIRRSPIGVQGLGLSPTLSLTHTQGRALGRIRRPRRAPVHAPLVPIDPRALLLARLLNR